VGAAALGPSAALAAALRDAPLDWTAIFREALAVAATLPPVPSPASSPLPAAVALPADVLAEMIARRVELGEAPHPSLERAERADAEALREVRDGA